MRDYSQVRPRFWIAGTGKKFRGDKDAQIVAFYLMTGPQTSMTGLYYLPLQTLSHETGLPFEDASKGLARVCQEGFAEYDEDSEVVWVCSMVVEQVGKSLKPQDNNVKGIANALKPYRDTPLFWRFVERYREAYHLPWASPLQAPSKPRTGTGYGTGPGTEREGARAQSADLLLALCNCWDGVGGLAVQPTARETLRLLMPRMELLAGGDVVKWFGEVVGRFRADESVRRKGLGLPVLLSQLDTWAKPAPPPKGPVQATPADEWVNESDDFGEVGNG